MSIDGSRKGEAKGLRSVICSDVHEAVSSRTRRGTRQKARGQGEDEAAGKSLRRGRGSKAKDEARQQYRTKFVNSVYEIKVIATTHMRSP